MVGGDHIDGAIQDALDQCFLVFCRADGRVHFEPAVLLQHGVVHGQVVGCCFAGHVQSFRFRLTDQRDTFLGGNVADVVFHAGLLYQLQVSFDLLPLAFGRDAFMSVLFGIFPLVDVAAEEQAVVFAVGSNDLAVALDFFHGLAHHFVILYAPAIVRESADMGGQLVIGRHGLAYLANGDGAVGHNFNAGGFLDGLKLRLQIFHAVGRGLQVWHGADCRIAAVGRCQSAGFNGLFIKKARLSQMYVNINETGK